MSNSPALELPYILPAQAQKHVTHNEAIDWLDTLVQMSVFSRSLTAPPTSPASGDRYLVALNATGAWTGQDGALALYLDGAWLFRTPREGWRAWVADEQVLLLRDQAAWQVVFGGSGGQSGTLPSGENAIINGDMGVWQRGSGPHSGTSAGAYGADRWKMTTTGVATITMSRDPAVPNGQFPYSAYCQIANLSPTDQIILSQTVEGGANLVAAGDVTLAFYLRGPVGADVTFGVDSATSTHICSGNWDPVQATFSGLTPQSNGTCEVTLLSDLATDGGYGLTGMQLVAGGAGQFPFRAAGVEEALCRRYFERLGGSDRALGRYQNAYGSQVALNPMLSWTTAKRIMPTVTATGDVNDGTSFTLTTHAINHTHVVLGEQVPAFGWLDVDQLDVDAEY